MNKVSKGVYIYGGFLALLSLLTLLADLQRYIPTYIRVLPLVFHIAFFTSSFIMTDVLQESKYDLLPAFFIYFSLVSAIFLEDISDG